MKGKNILLFCLFWLGLPLLIYLLAGNPEMVLYSHVPQTKNAIVKNIEILKNIKRPTNQNLLLIAQNYQLLSDYPAAKTAWLNAFARVEGDSLSQKWSHLPYYAKIGYIEALIETADTSSPDEYIEAQRLLLSLATVNISMKQDEQVRLMLFYLDQYLPQQYQLSTILAAMKKSIISIPIELVYMTSFKQNEDAILFISVSDQKQAQGMPIAAKRIPVSDIDKPISISSLDELGARKIADFDRIYVRAQLSADSDVTLRSGDLMGQREVSLLNVPEKIKIKLRAVQ